jgi:putative RNA 2'-phosphotransferase
MDKRRQTKISKFLSYVLRHNPDSIGIQLDNGGWVDVSELLQAAEQKGFPITEGELKTVVKQSDKQRFSFNEDATRIRANYGHSISIELGYNPEVPPNVLYHGTAAKNIKAISVNGLTKGNRQYVHLSPDPETAKSVGQRHGKPLILEVLSGRMHSDGYRFYHSSSNIWLTEYVPPVYLVFPGVKHA